LQQDFADLNARIGSFSRKTGHFQAQLFTSCAIGCFSMLFVIILLHGSEPENSAHFRGEGWVTIRSGGKNEVLVEAHHATIMR
jgi:hypothetical protein